MMGQCGGGWGVGEILAVSNGPSSLKGDMCAAS